MRATNTAVMKPAVAVLRSCGVARSCTPSTLMYESSCAKIEPTSRSASALESSEYGASGPGVISSTLSAQRDRNRDERWQREGDAVPTGRRRGNDDEDQAEENSRPAFGPEHQAVRPEAPVARKRAARDVRDVVADDRDDEPEHERAVAAEEVFDDPRVRDETAGRHDECERAAEPRGLLDQWAAAVAARAAMRRAPDRPLVRAAGTGRASR